MRSKLTHCTQYYSSLIIFLVTESRLRPKYTLLRLPQMVYSLPMIPLYHYSVPPKQPSFYPEQVHETIHYSKN